MKVRLLIRRLGARVVLIQRQWRTVSFRNKLRFCVLIAQFIAAEEQTPGRSVSEPYRFSIINTWLRNQYRLRQERLEQEQMGFRPASRRTIEEQALRALDLADLVPARPAEEPTRWWTITEGTFPLLVQEARRSMKGAKAMQRTKTVGNMIEAARRRDPERTSKERRRVHRAQTACASDMRNAAVRLSKESEPD